MRLVRLWRHPRQRRLPGVRFMGWRPGAAGARALGPESHAVK